MVPKRCLLAHFEATLDFSRSKFTWPWLIMFMLLTLYLPNSFFRRFLGHRAVFVKKRICLFLHNLKEILLLLFIKNSSKIFHFQSRSISLYSCKSKGLFIKKTLCFKQRVYASKKLSLVSCRLLFVLLEMRADRSRELWRILLIWGMVNNICHVLPRVIAILSSYFVMR